MNRFYKNRFVKWLNKYVSLNILNDKNDYKIKNTKISVMEKSIKGTRTEQNLLKSFSQNANRNKHRISVFVSVFLFFSVNFWKNTCKTEKSML